MTPRATPFRIAVIGAGGIGHPAIAVLIHEPAVALTVIDDDRVESSNLHRLPFATEAQLGAYKTDVFLGQADPARYRAVHDRLTPDTAEALLRGSDLVVDASDNYATRFLAADACGLREIPSVHGAAVGWLGTVLSVVPGRSACYRCIFEDPPEGDAVDCASAGVYGPVTSVVGALMAADALRLARGDGRFVGCVGSYDGWRNTFRNVPFRPRASCPLCGTRQIRDLQGERSLGSACKQ